MRVVIRAYNADGYHRDILVLDERQERMRTDRVKDGWDGPAIDPKDFPEMARFEVVVERP
jgi:hypothetical protein